MAGSRFLSLPRAQAFIACLLLGFALIGCEARFISDYDEIFDKAVTDTQKKTDGFLLKLQDDRARERKYAVAKPIYEDILNDIHSLKVRAQANNAQSLNQKTIDQINFLEANFQKIQAQHEKTPNGPSVAFVRDAEDSVDIQFESILKLEIAKKRGSPKT